MNANNDPQDLWKRNDPSLPQPPDATGICAMARREERSNVWGRGIGLFALSGFVIAFASAHRSQIVSLQPIAVIAGPFTRWKT